MDKVNIANIVKKITELSKEDKKLLTRLLNKIDDGGGSGPTVKNVVQYIPQELSEDEQMQARKNQGLYWKTEQTTYGEKETTQPESWSDTFAFYDDGFTKQNFIDASVDDGFFEGLFKVSDDAPAISDLISVSINDYGNQTVGTVVDSQRIVYDGNENDIYQGEGFYGWYSYYYGGEFHLWNAAFIVVTSDNGVDFDDGTYHLDKGIYCAYSGNVQSADESTWEVTFGVALNYNVETTVVDISKIPSEYVEAVAYKKQSLKADEQMQARVNQGLYAKVKGEESVITWDGDITDKEYVTISGLNYYNVEDYTIEDIQTLIYKGKYTRKVDGVIEEVDNIPAPFTVEEITNDLTEAWGWGMIASGKGYMIKDSERGIVAIVAQDLTTLREG